MARTFKLGATVLLFLAFAASSHAQDNGYSYVRLSVNGRPVTNLVWDRKHTGWMRVLGVEARLHEVHKRADGATSHVSVWAIRTLDDGRTLLPFPKSGQGGPGELSFAAGDDGDGLGPLLHAQKEKIKIPTAELDRALFGHERVDGPVRHQRHSSPFA